MILRLIYLQKKYESIIYKNINIYNAAEKSCKS